MEETVNVNPTFQKTILCPVCNEPIVFRLAKGRKSGKSFIMLVCKNSGKHWRGFIADQTYVSQVLNKLEQNKE